MNSKVDKSEEISLEELIKKGKEWYGHLLLQWRIILIAGIIGAIVGMIFSVLNKPTYKASLSFALEDEKSGGGLGSALGLAGSLGLDLGGGGSLFSASNLTELFKSRTMVEKTLLTPVNVNDKVISLAEMYIQNNNWRESWDEKTRKVQFLPSINRKGFTREQDSILGVIYGNLSKKSLSVAQKDKKNAIVTVDVVSNSELFSLYFCEALTRQVGKFYVETKSKKARMNMEVLDKQTDSIRHELNGAITGVAVANDNAFNLNPALNVRRAPSARRQVDVQANTAILTELVKQSELAKVTLRKETPLIQIIDKPILPLPKEKFGKMKGILLGGFIFGFLAIFCLIIRKILNETIS